MLESTRTKRSQMKNKKLSSTRRDWAKACTGICVLDVASNNRVLQNSAKAVGGTLLDQKATLVQIAPTANIRTSSRKDTIMINIPSVRTPSYPKLPHHRLPTHAPNQMPISGAAFVQSILPIRLDLRMTNQRTAILALLVNSAPLRSDGWSSTEGK